MDAPDRHDADSFDWDEPTVEIPVLVASVAPPPPSWPLPAATFSTTPAPLPISVPAPIPAPMPAPVPVPVPELHTPGVRRLLFAGMAVALFVLGGLVIASVDRRGPAAPQAVAAPGVESPAATEAPAGDRGFELVSSAAAVTVRTADLGGDLYRINGAAPRATDDGTRLRLVLADRSGPVELVLADQVRWDLSVGGGADRRRIDLAGGQFRGISLHDGANQVELRLPHPDGTLTVTLAGGVGRFDVHTAGPVPVRVRLGSGAGQVVLSGKTHSGVAPGALFTPEKWDAGGDRIDLAATAGMNLLTVLS